MPLYRRTQALALRDKMFAVLEEAAVNGRDRDLRIVVVGGGATGVEMAGALTELRDNDLHVTYPELNPARVHITLVERSRTCWRRSIRSCASTPVGHCDGAASTCGSRRR